METAERFADGLATPEEFRDAGAAMYAYANREATTEQQEWVFGSSEKHSVHSHCLMSVFRSRGVMNLATMNAWHASLRLSGPFQPVLLRDIFGNPFRPVTFSPEWRTDTALSLARQMYESRDFAAMPILADPLQDAGCDDDAILSHCRGEGSHVRGCWVVDLVLGKQ